MHRTLWNHCVGGLWTGQADGFAIHAQPANEWRLSPYIFYKLNPFAVTGSSTLYDGINAHGELDRYDPVTSSPTDQYLKDYVASLKWELQFGTHDTEPVGDAFFTPQNDTHFFFEGYTSNAIITKMCIDGDDFSETNWKEVA